MEGDPWERLGWWWNGSHAQTDDYGHTMRRDVWLERHRLTGQFRVRWRGGWYTSRDGQRVMTSSRAAIAVVQRLTGYEKAGWLESIYIDENGEVARAQ